MEKENVISHVGKRNKKLLTSPISKGTCPSWVISTFIRPIFIPAWSQTQKVDASQHMNLGIKLSVVHF